MNKNIEAIYPLSHMQQGMLFHTLYDPESSVYFEQLSCTLHGNLNQIAFKQAWQQVIDRHPILRTLIVLRNKPLQLVKKQVKLPWIEHDWRNYSDCEQRLAEFLHSDRQQGFILDKAPLMRCAIIQITDDSHYFVLSSHHLLMDGWCLPIILKEVFTFYESQQFDSPKPRPYRDYILWLQEQDLAKAKEFWIKHLQGFKAPTPFQVDKMVSDNSGQYLNQSFGLSQSITERLEILAHEYHLTLNVFVQGALSLLLSNYSGNNDIVFGATVSGRPTDLVGVESMVGLFINTLPMRVIVEPDLLLLPWLESLHKQQIECRAYNYTPLVEIQKHSELPNDIPLFESLLVFENYPMQNSSDKFGSLTIDSLQSFEKTNYPLTIAAFVHESKLKFDISYISDRFATDTIIRMAVHLTTLLESMITNLETKKLGDISLLTVAEKQQLLAWNNTKVDYPSNQTIIDLFTQQVSKTPNNIAVVFENQKLTYLELNQQSNQLGHYLQTLGVKPEVLVGICVERSLEMIIGLLGILKAGGAYLPLDPSYPTERLSFMLEDAQVSILLAQSNIELSAAQIIYLDKENFSQYSFDNVISGVKPDNLAYVIYTSGSTGKPKGVLIRHQGLYNLAQSQIKNFYVQENSKILQFASLNFDASISEIAMSIGSGATLYLTKPGLSLVKLLRKNFITHITLPPTALAILPKEDNAKLQHIIVAGESCLFELAKRWSKNRHFFNAYGPTEITVCATIFKKTDDKIATLPIGRPIYNTQIYILDKYLQPVPIGVLGELHIGGIGLARGYLNHPELTAEKFITNPFSADPNSRIYKTGDLARYLPDGNIEYLGRIDNQVKIRGFRIELGEIETVLGQHPIVRENTVIVHETDSNDKILIAYLVLYKEVENIELHNFLKIRLPDYMIPSTFVTLESLPLTPNGKIDRRSLAKLSLNRQDLLTELVAPRTPEEELLANIWVEILGVVQIGIHDNFFKLGGHSLLATQVISRIRDIFKVELPLSDLFATPTIAELSKRLNRQKSSLPSITPVNRSESLQLSFSQQRLWILNQLDRTASATYNMPAALQLKGKLNKDILEQSLQILIQRHESLHTIFTTIDDKPIVKILKVDYKLPIVNLTNISQSEVELLLIKEAQKPFNLETGPLFRSKLFQLDEKLHILLINMHHIISDGWSISILIKEWNIIYKALVQNKKNPLPSLTIQYADYANWQRQWLTGEILQQQINYWQQQLANIPVLLELPTDKKRPPIQSFKGASLPISLELTTSLRQLSQQNETTLFMTLWSVFAVLLFRYSEQTDIVIGSPIANRIHSQTESIIGFFVNTLVLRLDLSDNPSFTKILKQAQQVALEAYSHQDIPFEQLVETLQPERNLSHTPLFQVMFVLQNINIPNLKLEDLEIEFLELENTIAKFDLTLSLEETASGLKGMLEYNTDLFEHSTIERMAGHFQTLLNGIIENPETGIYELSLLTEVEKQQLLDWNNTKVDYPSNETIIDLFTQQACKTPNNIAVVFESQSLTYRELNQKSNQLGHCLQTLGVKPEALVGICVERSLEMIIGLLGILKAGGAYLPLDPTYPTERLTFMLEDAQVSILLTQSNLKLPNTQAQIIYLDREDLTKHSSKNIISEAKSENLAYVIYTSGSTGKPKGVMIQHATIVAHCYAVQDKYELTSNDRILQFASLSFDASLEQIFATFITGARLILRGNHIWTPAELCQEIINHKMTVVNFPPAYCQQWLQTVNKFPELIKQNCLKLVIVGGDEILPDLIQSWKLMHPIRLLNAYGPTETTITTTIFEVSKYNLHRIPIGRPLANKTIYILDKHKNQAPIGVSGELHIGGIGLARGYLNRPELTAEKFIKNPFSTDPNSRIYETGDLARYLPDGNIEYLGRIDNQVKIRGFRIELGEIETVLRQHNDVLETAVIAKTETNGDKRLKAYFVYNLSLERIPYQKECLVSVGKDIFNLQTKDISYNGLSLSGKNFNKDIILQIKLPNIIGWLLGTVVWNQEQLVGVKLQLRTSEQTILKNICDDLIKEKGLLNILQRTFAGNIRQYLQKKLPNYMIPSAFIMLDSLPLTPNGKIDRQALESLSDNKSIVDTMPQTADEKLLAKIWNEILNVQQIGIHDNFFELGGHSLLAIQLIAELNKRFDVEIPLQELFAAPTVAGMVKVIDKIRCHETIDSIDFDNEAILDASIQPATLPVSSLIKSVFLTGATGFLGVYLLYELLLQTTADIYCLARSKDKDILSTTLKSYMLWDEAFSSRIIHVHGDLSKPLLNMKLVDFEKMASVIDIIYHNGAWVNHIYPYPILKTTNVLGTHEILKLASTCKAKPVHFISTIGTITETVSGYIQSKSVAEKLVEQANERGLSTCIYRPSRITGHSKTGSFNQNDMLNLTIKGCIQLGKAPKLKNTAEYMIPVDYISRTIVKLSLQHSDKTFNLTSSSPISWNEMLTKIGSLGYVLEQIPYNQWRNELSLQTDNALYPILAALPVEIELTETESQLEQHEKFVDPDWPIIDDKLLDIYFESFWKSGFLKRPLP